MGSNDITGSYFKGSTTQPASSWGCRHIPKAVQVGAVSIYPCANRGLTSRDITDFDVVSPLITHDTAVLDSFYGLILWFPIHDMRPPSSADRLRVHAQRLNHFAKTGNRVAVFCEGGHGRTGMVLATCIGLEEPDVDPIDAARARHCKEACETHAQIAAVFAALKRPLPDKWKQIPIAQPPKYVSNNRWWPETTERALSTLSSANSCDFCNEADRGELDKLHFYGKVLAHRACWENYKLQQPATAERGVAIITPDAPIRTLNVVPPEQQLAVSHMETWSRKNRKRFEKAKNGRDEFGDVICQLCEDVIEDPTDTSIVEGFAIHNDCVVYAKDDAEVGTDVPPASMSDLAPQAAVVEDPTSKYFGVTKTSTVTTRELRACTVCRQTTNFADGFCSDSCALKGTHS